LNAARHLVDNPLDEKVQRFLNINTSLKTCRKYFHTSCDLCPLGFSTGFGYTLCSSVVTSRIKGTDKEGVFILRLIEFIAMIEAQQK
jgi:hypothetical protein